MATYVKCISEASKDITRVGHEMNSPSPGNSRMITNLGQTIAGHISFWLLRPGIS